MIDDPLNRLFPTELPDESVDLLFTFLNNLTDAFFDVYQEQLVRMAQQETDTDLAEPPDILDADFDDDFPC